MLTLADVEEKLVGGQGPAGGSGEYTAMIETDKGKLTVWKPGSYGTYIELRLAPWGEKSYVQPHYCCEDALEAQCRIMGWDLTLKETE